MKKTDASQIENAVRVLRKGGLVALPTETVYGLAADAENELAVRRIFAVKGRPASHPLIVHLPAAEDLKYWAREIPDEAKALAKAFWPGPLTLVLQRTQRASNAVTGRQDTVAVRVPAHPLAQAVLRKFGGGLAAPSANRYGKISPTTAEHVRRDLGDDVECILDGGPCKIGVESTIVDLSGETARVLRPGGVPHEALERTLKHPIPVLQGESQVRAPGTLPSHYAPRAGLVLVTPETLRARVQAEARAGKKVAVLSPVKTPMPRGARHFLAPKTPAAMARKLYALLRDIDDQGFDLIVALTPSTRGLGLAVRDRLERAAAPRHR